MLGAAPGAGDGAANTTHDVLVPTELVFECEEPDNKYRNDQNIGNGNKAMKRKTQ